MQLPLWMAKTKGTKTVTWYTNLYKTFNSSKHKNNFICFAVNMTTPFFLLFCSEIWGLLKLDFMSYPSLFTMLAAACVNIKPCLPRRQIRAISSLNLFWYLLYSWVNQELITIIFNKLDLLTVLKKQLYNLPIINLGVWVYQKDMY